MDDEADTGCWEAEQYLLLYRENFMAFQASLEPRAQAPSASAAKSIDSHLYSPGSSSLLLRNAMGVSGLHVLCNAFSDETHARLYSSLELGWGGESRKLGGTEIAQTQGHSLASANCAKDIFRIFNAVRDSGLFPQACVPSGAMMLEYPSGAQFPLHHDGRKVWGEYVVVASFGGACTLTFRLAISPTNPVDPSFKAPDASRPPRVPYFTHCVCQSDPHNGQGKESYQVSTILPPNSLYIMSGCSRVDWKHGIDTFKQLPVPVAGPFVAHTLRAPLLRRCVIFRNTKIDSDVALERERDYLAAKMHRQPERFEPLVTSLERRIAASAHLGTDHRDPKNGKDTKLIYKTKKNRL